MKNTYLSIIGIMQKMSKIGRCEIIINHAMVELHLPKSIWVIIEANVVLPYSIQNTYKSFYTEWLPNSVYNLDDLPVIECYLQDDRQELWIAIKPSDK